ncbi:MAG: helix-turn-helix domain-containing protein [Actinomycetota bacterium]
MGQTRKRQTSSDQLQFPVAGSDYREEPSRALLLTVKEAAALMRIGRDTTYALVAQRRIPCVKLGKQIRIPRKALIAHLEKEALQQALDIGGSGGAA